jgi:hypothetical protein
VIRRALLLGAASGQLVLLSAPVAAQSVGTNGAKATASVKVVKPLQLTAVRNLQFGTVLLGTFSGTQDVSITPAGRTCGSGAGLTCSGLFSTAQYRVNGTNNQVALISSATPTVTLSNGAGATLILTPSFPASVAFSNSGNQGVLFEVGGTLSFNSAMADGVYTGTLDIQVAYQ